MARAGGSLHAPFRRDLPILASAAQAEDPPTPITVTAYRWAPFLSPMGEPFRSRTPDDDPFARWFHQADGNRDGMLTADEMRADAERFFAALDSNQDGKIDSMERMTYESKIAPEVQVNSQWKRTRQETAAEAQASDETDRGDRRRRWDNNIDGYQLDGLQGAARYGLLNLPEPVSGADADFDRIRLAGRIQARRLVPISTAGQQSLRQAYVAETRSRSCPPDQRRAAAPNAPRMP